jgi:phosphonate transport system substrate-binding protein
MAPLEEYLEKELGIDVLVETSESYASLIEKMRDGKIDIGLFGPFSYILAENGRKLDPLVVREYKAHGVAYHSVIVVPAESRFASIEDLRGSLFAFVDEASTSGYAVPLALFRSRQIDPEDYFASVLFAGSHDQSLDLLLAGEVDAAVVAESLLDRRLAMNALAPGELRVIWRSAPIPGSPYVACPGLSRRLRTSFTEAMTAMAEKAPETLARLDPGILRFVPADRSMYEGVRNIVAVLGREFTQSRLAGN